MLYCMDVRKRITAIEGHLRQRGLSVARICRESDLHPTTWLRWKAGQAAKAESWGRVELALERVCPEALAAGHALAA